MKKKFFSILTLSCFVIVCVAFTANLAGKWTGTIKSADGNEFPVTYNFKTDSGKLTGSSTTPMGEFSIANGKMITATEFTFILAINGVDVKNSGKFYPQGDSISMNIDYDGSILHSTLKRNADK